MTKGGITPNQRARVIALAKTGEYPSTRKVAAALEAEGVKLSHVTCSAILVAANVRLPKGLRAASAPKGPAKRGKPAKGAQGSSAAPPDEDPPESEPPPVEELDEVLESDRAFVEGAIAMKLPEMPPLAADAPPATLQAWCNLMDARSLLAALRPKLLTGEVSYANFKSALDSSIKAADALTARMPKAEPDPSKDPVNVGAREMVRAHVRKVVHAVELRSGRLCVECGAKLAADT